MRHGIRASAWLAAGMAVLSTQAQALISITPASSPVFTTNQVSALSASQVASLVGYVGPLSLVYKRNVEGTPLEEGSAAAYYGTTFDLSPNDPSKATLVWNGPIQIIVCQACYLVVKDGNQTPAQYVFDIVGWNGQETIELTGFWPAQGAISHVAIFSTGTIAPVPEAETYAMLLAGLGLVGVAVRRRRR